MAFSSRTGSWLLSAAALAVCVGAASQARADVLPPKVCVAVASDPDVAVRDAARAFSTALAARTDVRTLADADTTAALRGEPSTSTWAEQRRGLHATEQDAPALVMMGEALGCAYWIELAARPAGLAVRGFDVVGHTFFAPREAAVVDLPVINAAVQQLLDARAAAVANTATANTTTSANTSASATATTTTATSTTATATTASTTNVPPGANVTPPARNAQTPPKDKGPGVLGWVIAGGAALALITTFIVVAATTGPNVPTISVVHPPPGVAP